MGPLGGLRDWLIHTLSPFAASNVSIIFLAGVMILLVMTMFFLPTVEDMISRANFGGDRRRWTSVMIRQAQALRPTKEKKLSAKVKENLYRGGQSNDIMDVSSDFFRFLRFVCGAIMAGLGVVAVLVLGAPPFFLGLAVVGYLLPGVIATMHNRGRKKKIMASLAQALPRLATAMDMERGLRGALAKVAASDKGPLYDELDWAAGQMTLAVRNDFDVLRELDTRNGIAFFGPLADAAEREAQGSDARFRAIVREYINEALNDHYGELDRRLGNLANKVIVIVAIPMMIGVMVTLMGPIVLSLIDTLGGAKK